MQELRPSAGFDEGRPGGSQSIPEEKKSNHSTNDSIEFGVEASILEVFGLRVVNLYENNTQPIDFIGFIEMTFFINNHKYSSYSQFEFSFC